MACLDPKGALQIINVVAINTKLIIHIHDT